MKASDLWLRYKEHFFCDSASNFSIDLSRVNFSKDFFKHSEPIFKKALLGMERIEKGEICNLDEQRMVGHYWLRDSKSAPSEQIRVQIDTALKNTLSFAQQVREGTILAPSGSPFRYLLILGIGGSALGPQFMAHALSKVNDPLKAFFIDNTDPECIAKTVSLIPDLSRTLVIVISKSGGTPETRNGMIEVKAKFKQLGIKFDQCAVAITQEGSALDKVATSEKWLARFPMWDWVGGRTSITSVVGLLPAALQGFDIEQFLSGASYMDDLTRSRDLHKNPAALMALAWHSIGAGRGQKDMVVLPYRDRLELFSRYLQQLVMESIGKERDLDGKIVNQGLAVYGNKGSTDQHAYVQQLRDGLDNFFVTFVVALSDSVKSRSVEVEPGITSADYLYGFYLGTRQALYEKGRQSITLTVAKVDEYNVGMLIALFERTVSIYADLVNINAYHQPGVEAGKKAAAEVLAVQSRIVSFLKSHHRPTTIELLAQEVKSDPETVWHLVRHLTAQGILNCDGSSLGEIRIWIKP